MVIFMYTIGHSYFPMSLDNQLKKTQYTSNNQLTLDGPLILSCLSYVTPENPLDTKIQILIPCLNGMVRITGA